MGNLDFGLYSKIALAEDRRPGARELAAKFGAKDLLIFDFDDEVGRFLPSLGFPQTISGGKAWGQFLLECLKAGAATAQLAFPNSHSPSHTTGKCFDQKIIFAFAEMGRPFNDSNIDLSLLAANLLKVFNGERQASRFHSHSTTLHEFSNDLRTYAEALNRAKSDLRAALQDAQSAKDIAEKANATKSAFLANMSHEIRTPLGAILGFSSFLKDPSLPEAERVQYVDTINRNGQVLTRIIDDILDLAKVEAGRIEIEQISFSIIRLIDDAMDLFKDRTKQKGIFLLLTVDDNVPSAIFSDPTRLRQILINIIGNAVKFTETGGVRIHVRHHEDGESLLKISIEVRDTGPGLTDEQKARLFQPFTQADNTTTRKFGGTGLGLVLSKRLAEALGGSVTTGECESGKGCTFTISFKAMVSKLPDLSQSIEMQRNKIRNNVQPLKGTKILLVEDSEDNQVLINHILTKYGAEVQVASDGQQGVNLALRDQFDIVLMDIQMPIMDGYEAISKLRAVNYQTPIVALTAHAMLEERHKTRTAGFVAHLTKPLEFEQLIETITHFKLAAT